MRAALSPSLPPVAGCNAHTGEETVGLYPHRLIDSHEKLRCVPADTLVVVLLADGNVNTDRLAHLDHVITPP